MIKKLNFLRINGVNYIEVTFLVSFLSAMLIGIFFRYILGRPIFWIEEFARDTFIWSIFIGAIIVSRKRAHIKIDYFVNLIPYKLKKMVLILVRVLILIQDVVVVWYGFKLVYKFRMMSTAAMSMPLSFLYVVVPISFLLMFLEDCINIKGIYDSGNNNELERSVQKC